MTEDSNLFAEFSSVSKEAWLEKVEKDLKGKSLDSLNWQLEEAINLSPFYHSDDQIPANNIYRDQTDNEWLVGESFEINDPVVANKALLNALEKGTNAPLLVFEHVPDVDLLDKVLEKIIPAYIHLSFKITEGSTTDYSTLLQNYYTCLSVKGLYSSDLKGSLHLNSDTSDNPKDILDKVLEKFPLYRSLAINLKPSDEGSAVQVLTDLLIKSDQLFQKIEAHHINGVYMTLEIGNNYFIEIAKIRAARLVWANLLNAYKIPPEALVIDAYIAPTAYDENANTNMIRSMTIALSAVIGGIDRLTVLPAQKEPEHAKRIARNVQHLLKMESYLHRVIDPAAGSFYIEKLTNLLAEEAWNRFTAL